jgi:hypothetical protein
LSEVLNRDFKPARGGKPETQGHDRS